MNMLDKLLEGLTTEDAMKKLLKASVLTEEDTEEQTDRFVELLVDLIAERSEEKAEEMIENHKIDYDHDLLYGR